MTDWKSIPKIDAHVHLMPNDVIEAYKDYRDKFVDNGSVNDYMKIMEKYNIEKAIIMPFNDAFMLSMDNKIETVHENLSEMCAASRDKLYCFADIDIRNEIDKTIAELDRVISRKNFLGVKIHASNTGYPLDGEYYDRIFEWAHRKNVLVEIHSYPRTHISDDVCSPARIKRMIEKYPDLRLSIAHMAGFQYQELLGLNVYVNISAILPDYIDKYGAEKTNEILRQFRVEHLIFATDYPDSRSLKPDEIYDRYLKILADMDFTHREAEMICRENAINMLKTRL